MSIKAMVVHVGRPSVSHGGYAWEIQAVQPIQLPEYQCQQTGAWLRPKVIRNRFKVIVNFMPKLGQWIDIPKIYSKIERELL